MNNMSKRSIEMFPNVYEVKIFADGKIVDTVKVGARDEWHAQTMAMMATDISFSGELIEYEVAKA